MFLHRSLTLATLLAACSAGHAFAAEKPLWEQGAGISALSLPDYRGSDQSSLYAIPFPYLVYRGEFLKADRHGIRGTFFDSDRIELNLSLGASLPVNSDDNRARQGMPDLQPTVELGPSLDLNLWRTTDRRTRLDLRLPVRTAVTVKGGMDDIGWVFSPRLNLDISDVAGLAGWNLGLLAGPMVGSERNHDYFYSVAPQYATAGRPAFDAKGGYAGSQFLMSASKRYPKYWLGAFARWDSLKGAVFADSPLVKREDYFAAGVGIAWILGESSTRVEAVE
ncbi:MipA/OmpV family protein [Thiobacillus denitrificans]|uniref:Membrane protein n=1 Tax=Thiobacillus denitrificans TaxID=36861 RepID=A0A106BRI3_THIDE|nr:MipA/OmpV family protein [Thiobacillus denitrificans]KVW97305.1 membrane protein [Thiobacillus denitrificans]